VLGFSILARVLEKKDRMELNIPMRQIYIRLV